MERVEHAPPKPEATWLIFAILASGVAAFTLLQSFVLPVLTQIQDAYDTDQTTVTWVLTAYLLSASVATPLAGRIGDGIGRKKALAATLTLLAVGSLAAAVAPSIEWLIAARVIQGLGGGVLPLSFGLIRDVFPAHRVQHAMGIVAAIGAVGFGVGVVAAGPIVDALSQQWLFWIPMIVTATAAVATIWVVPESRELTPGRVNPLPPLLFTIALLSLLLAISQGQRAGWTSWPIIGLFSVSTVLAVLWVVSETRVAVPFVDMHMMRVRGVWSCNLVAFLTGFGMFASYAFLPQLLQTPTSTGYGLGLTTTESGQLLVPSSVFAMVSGLLTARLIKAFSARAVIAAGCLVTAVAFALFAVVHDEPWQILLGATLWGLGQGLVFSTMASVVTASVPAAQSGIANGMNANIRTIGGAIGTAAIAAIVTAQLTIAFPTESGYIWGLVTAAFVLVLATLAALAIPHIAVERMDEAAEYTRENAEMAPIPGAELPEDRQRRETSSRSGPRN